MAKFVFMVLAALLPLQALAASFNCDHAATKMEQMICSDAALSKTDEQLAAAYARALKAAGAPAAVKQQQRAWLADTAKHCDSVACLKSAYALRIKQLESGKQVASTVKAANAVPGLPQNILDQVAKEFPQCSSSEAVSVPIVGALAGDNERDMVVTIGCDADERGFSGSNLLLVLIKGKEGGYKIAGKKILDLTGMYGGIELTIEGTSLRMNFSYPGSDTAYVYSYQFRYDGKSVVLANMELQSFYHGDGERDEQNADYSVSVNYVTGEVSDSRDKSGTRKKGRLKKITLEGFSPGMEYTDEIAEGQ